ncbi:MAG: DUF2007-related protein [Bacteroidaceae bacterium]|nr:DUF2007-related protein [Bacteroidaceae bacterium]
MTAEKNNSRLVKIFSGDTFEVEVIRGLLAANEIISIVKDESVSLVTSPYSGIGGNVWVVVNEEDVEKARKIIADNRAE